MSLLGEARSLLGEAVALRRRIHRRPEIGLELDETQRAVIQALDGTGFDVRTGRSLSSVVATLDGAHPGPTVLLRADMDGLPVTEATGLEFGSTVPGAMHACGHDAHVAMLAAAARILAAHREEIHGRVLLMFQPGEEGFAGAMAMIREGLLDEGPAAAFAIHVHPQLPSGVVTTRPGPVMASADTLTVEVRGRGGHASAPHLALDPIPVAAEIVLALRSMVTRGFGSTEPVVLTVTRLAAGTADNVIPERAELQGTVRTLSPQARARVLRLAGETVREVGRAHGAEAELTVVPSYPPTVNDSAVAALVLDVAREALGSSRGVPMADPLMTAEDFSYVLERVPGCLALLGVAPPGLPPGQAAGLHSNRMVIDEAAMAHGIAVHAGVALRLLSAPPPPLSRPGATA